MEIISKNVIFYIPKKRKTPEKFKSLPGLVPVTVSSDTATSGRKRTAKGWAESMNGGSDAGEMEEVVIPNRDFTLSLLEVDTNTRFSIVSYSYCGGPGSSNPTIGVTISSPDLSREMGPGKMAFCLMSVRNFFDIMGGQGTGYITDRKIHGTFCITFEPSYLTSYTCPGFVFEDPTDKTLSDAKAAGAVITSGKGTSKWIPGHKYYVKSSGTIVLALGEIEGVLGESSYHTYSQYDYSLVTNIYGAPSYEFDRMRPLKKAKAYLKLTTASTKFLESHLGVDLIDFWKDLLKMLSGNNGHRWDYPLIFRVPEGAPVTGIDQGEALTFDSSFGSVSDQLKNSVASHTFPSGGPASLTALDKMYFAVWPEGLTKDKIWKDPFEVQIKNAVGRELSELKNNGFTGITWKNLIGSQTAPSSSSHYYRRTVYCNAYRWFQDSPFYSLDQAGLEKKLTELIKNMGYGG